MWACSHCGEELEEQFESCWKCGASRDGAIDPTFAETVGSVEEHADEPEDEVPQQPRVRLPEPNACSRCGGALQSGFLILEKGESAKLPMSWCSGKFEDGLFGAWLRVDQLCPLIALRCDACGNVEFFAQEAD